MAAEIPRSTPYLANDFNVGLPVQDSSPEAWEAAERSIIHPRLAEADIPEEALKPVIRDETVAGLGSVTLFNVRYSKSEICEEPRIHSLYAVERNGFRHAIEVTRPVGGRSTYSIVSFPGYTEPIEGRVRQSFQNCMSDKYPRATVITIGSNGIGATGDRYGWNERFMHGFEAMGEQRLELARALCGTTAVYLMGTSMGTIISHRALEKNLALPEDQRLNVRGQALLSPALVSIKNVLKDMVVRFPTSLTVDAIKEIGFKTPADERAYYLGLLRRYGISKLDRAPLAHQLIELLRGTSERRVANVVREVPTVVVAGQKDPVAQWEMWDRIRRAHPDMLHMEMIFGRGHILPLKPNKAHDKLHRAASGFFLGELVELETTD